MFAVRRTPLTARHNALVTAGALPQSGEVRRGRTPAATPDQVVEAAVARMRAGERLEVLAIARELGLARGTVYRWFGTRDELLGHVILRGAQNMLAQFRERATGTGGTALLETSDQFNRWLARSNALARLLEHERHQALGIICASDGVVSLGLTEAFAELIEAEAAAGTYQPPLDAATLSLALVKVGQAFLFNHGGATVTGDVETLHDVHAALLGVPRDLGSPLPHSEG